MNPNNFQPTRPYERIQVMDALRGFALFGILLVNSWSFSRNEWVYQTTVPNQWVNNALQILIDTKFITLFSMLFGAGFYIQYQRATSKGIGFEAYFTKRMAILFLIGCLHAYLLWFGDIIRSYAILGLVLLLVRDRSARATFQLAIVVSMVLTPMLFILNGVLAIRTVPEQIDGLPWDQFVVRAFTQGSYPEILRANWIIDPWHNFIQDMPLTLVSMFGKMLFGVWLAKIGFFRNPVAHKRLINSSLWWGSTVGVGCSVAFWAIKKGLLSTEEPWMIPVLFLVAGGLVLHSFFYLALFVTVYNGQLGARFLRFLVPVGRMGLSNYLGQTVISFALFYSTGMVGKPGLVGVLLSAVGVFVVQILLSRWWLSRNEFGPVEWFWRRLSYLGTDGKERATTV